MAQNFLYMFEFVVDDLLVTRPNKCAPEEYPTCCEISFRSSVFVSICDREYGQCVDTCAPKCGKCCLFSLESPVNEKDRLLIHVYKKKDDNCKFLLGATDMRIKPLFDKVTDDFDVENPNWMESVTRHHATMPDPKSAINKRGGSPPPDLCDDDYEGRKEQFCQTSEVTKGLLPLFSMKGEQTGNLMLIIRLVCNGPAIVTSFPFSRFCAASCCPKKSKPCSPKPCSPKTCSSSTNCGVCTMPDPCKKVEEKSPQCRRYFACNDDKGCPCQCEECEDEITRACKPNCNKSKKCKSPCRPPCRSCPPACPPPCPPPPCPPSCLPPCPPPCPPPSCCQKKKGKCGGDGTEKCGCCDECCMDECEAEDSCSDESSECCELQPCFIEPTRPDPGPEAYEEFEACLNGSGLTIRVLKDTHQMESIYDGTENVLDDDSGSECGDRPRSSYPNCDSNCETLQEILNSSSFAKNALRKRTAGRIVNNPQIPKVRANIKYAGADTGCMENYRIPFTKIKNVCNSLNKLDMYRKSAGGGCGGSGQCGCPPVVPPKQPDDTRSCCLQVDPKEIKNMLKGINVDARKKGIEVCYKTCEDTESDVFLVKLGAKKSCERKQHSVEIELKTPKVPIPCPVQKCTTETQIKEAELDAALSGVCKKGKGKKGKKGKGKKK